MPSSPLRLTSSVADTVKKFSVAGGAGSPEVKRVVRPKAAAKKEDHPAESHAKEKTLAAAPNRSPKGMCTHKKEGASLDKKRKDREWYWIWLDFEREGKETFRS